MLIKSRKLLAMPVVSLADGQHLGRVRALVVDPAALRVVALTLEVKGIFKEARFVPFDAVKSIGEHAVTVEEAGAVMRPQQSPELAALIRQPAGLVGARVISEDGRFLGVVDEYVFNIEGNIDHFVIDGGAWRSLVNGKALLPAQTVRTVGQGSLIVREGAAERLTWAGAKLVGLREGLRKYLELVRPPVGPRDNGPPPEVPS